MATYRPLLLALLAAAPMVASAQGINAGNCIVAGRLNEDGRWAPRFDSVQLLGGKDRVIKESKREALHDTQRVRITKPAVLTRCDGDREIARGEETTIPKEPVPAVAPGAYEVESIAFPRLRRGGELVEVKLKLPVERVVMVTR
ncbi:hypothetical protein [Ramlibacter albus]|uniref:Uncharacterized protein n=1 Tax=Ramlibacter albus TaxID=2079448 RepID=A0A923M3P0_9BURK|nr:hypothetical protein [Ramlibacter albus]MBC5763587.1 hypothetical protein [Ramlibacter albus]